MRLIFPAHFLMPPLGKHAAEKAKTYAGGIKVKTIGAGHRIE
jgi:hypothetical protein